MCASLESDENAEVEDMTPIARSFAEGEVDVRGGIVEEEEGGEEDVKWVGGLLIATGCATGAVEDGAPGAFPERPDSEAGFILIDLEPEEGAELRYGEA